MIKIGLIGAGNIGSRHLQALALLERQAVIQVVDPSNNSLEIARNRFAEVGRVNKTLVNAKYISNIEQLDNNLDVVIIASNSDKRREIIDKLLKYKIVKYLILEKFLFQRKGDFKAIFEILKVKNIKAWVNCARRMWAFYKELRNNIIGSNSIIYNVSGSNIGIGSNGIHFLDHFTFLTGSKKINLNTDLLNNGYLESKRSGFIEFTGSLYGTSNDKHIFSMTSYVQNNVPLIIQVLSDKIRCTIDELNSKAWIAEEKNNWQYEEVSFKYFHQSQLTHLVVKQIIDCGQCDLTSYEESMMFHLSILDALNKHLNQDSEKSICPIT